MTTILLARHGETDWNLNRRVQGHSDTPLNNTGRAQARALGEELAGERIDAVYSSDLVRERHFGTWEGMTDDEIFARFDPTPETSWGDGETREEMAERVLDALRRIAATHPESRVLVVSHGGPLRAVLTHCGVDGVGRIDNCHVVRVEIMDGVLRGVD
jgi:broad specificity phosphatase PhoE